MTLSINDTQQHNTLPLYCVTFIYCYAECLSVFILSVWVSLYWVSECLYTECLSVFMLSVFMLSVFMLSVFMLSVFMLSVFVLSVFMLSVLCWVCFHVECHYAQNYYAECHNVECRRNCKDEKVCSKITKIFLTSPFPCFRNLMFLAAFNCSVRMFYQTYQFEECFWISNPLIFQLLM